MSHTILNDQAETNDMMVSAINSLDADYVYKVANRLADIPGWEEEVKVLRKKIRTLTSEDWAYDESVNN